MKIKKTTTNMAARCGVALFVTINDNNVSQSMFHRDEDETVDTVEISGMVDGEPADEYDAIYRVGKYSPGLFYMGSLTGRGEEFPNRILNEKSLRELLPAISNVVRR